jgi:hypothetical protein
MKPLTVAGAVFAVIAAMALPVPAVAASGSAGVKDVVVSASQPWTDTNIQVSVGDTILLKASGMINVFAGNPQYSQTPAGRGPANPTCVASAAVYGGNWVADGLPCWSLIGQIGDSAPFFVGVEYLTVAQQSGELHLGVNDQNGTFGDNNGTWSVQVAQVRSIPHTGRDLETFDRWLTKCLDGELEYVYPGCRDDVIGAAGLKLTDLPKCFFDSKQRVRLALCIGPKAASAIYWIWERLPKPGPVYLIG